MKLDLPIALAFLGLMAGTPAAAQDAELPERSWIDSIDVSPLTFEAVEPDRYEVAGVTVFHLVDATTPLVDVVAHFRGGYTYLGRERYAAGTALPSLLRTAGSNRMSPAEVDEHFEYFAAQAPFGGSGNAISSSINVLEEHLDTVLTVWTSLMKAPAFEAERVEVWRARELESVRRRADDPGRLAFSEYNRLLYGDHPIGWEMTPEDLSPERVNTEVLEDVHRRIVCPSNLTLGVVGPLEWDEVRPRIERVLDGWDDCSEPLPDAPIPEVGAEPGVYLIERDLDQSTIVLAQPVELPQGDTPDYFASRIGHVILGASGLSSRLNQRLRTQLGYTYGASSVWTTPRTYPGLVGATTQVRTDATPAAIEEAITVIERMRSEPPRPDEIADRVTEAVNGWVFNFESPAQILTRRISFQVAGLPETWLERYLAGISAVTPEQVRSAFETHVQPGAWVILVVGDPSTFPGEMSAFGPVRRLEVR